MKSFASTVKFNLRGRFTACCAIAVGAILFARMSSAQNVPYQRTFPQSKAIVEKRVKELQSSSAGQLPSLEGFTVSGDLPLDRFRRGYYQCVAQVSSSPSGGSMVRVNATITAWYTDPVSGKSGYQVLPSNGRLEDDFLDRVKEALGGQGSPSDVTPAARSFPPQTTGRVASSGVFCAASGQLARGKTQNTTRFAIQVGRSVELGSYVSIGHPKGSARSTRRGAGKRSQGPGGDPPQSGPSKQPGCGEEGRHTCACEPD